MKVKFVRNEHGEMVPTVEEGDEPLDITQVDFGGNEAEPSMEQRRAQIAYFERTEQRKVAEAFDIFLRHGKEALTDEQRALGTDPGSAGGFLTPLSFADRFTMSLKQHDELFDVATLVETIRGTAFSMPLDDDAGAVATIVAESGQSVGNSPVTFGNLVFDRCPTWRSGHIIASMELVGDSAFPLADVLANLFGARFARGCGGQFVSNLLTDATVGATTAAAGTVTGSELLDLVNSLDSAYANGGAFLMNSATWTAIQKANLTSSGYKWTGRDVNGHNTLFDYPVYASPSMPDIGGSNKIVCFGALDRFVQRRVRGSLVVKSYFELYATAGAVGYEAFLRVDGKLQVPATSPIPVRVLQCHG